MPELYNKAKEFVKESFAKNNMHSKIKHFERTVYWAKKLNPKADEALLIAAIAHDIERAFMQKDVETALRSAGFTAKEVLKLHEERGAKIIGRFLKKQGAGKKLVEKVEMLVSRHEEGGNKEQNLLKDSDSISFFENNIKSFLERKNKFGKEKIKQKFDWMYNRIT